MQSPFLFGDIMSIDNQFYDLLCEKTYWQLTYDKALSTGKYSAKCLDDIYYLIETGSYKNIASQICSNRYDFGVPEKVKIAKSESNKFRIIYKYEEFNRYLLSVLYRVTSVVFSDRISDLCFSYKTGVCTADAIREIYSKATSNRVYGVKLDIHAYFNSVSEKWLRSCIDDLIDSKSNIYQVFDKLFFDNNVIYHGEIINEFKSLIPGCALGSFFANYCLHEIDEYFKGKNITYARYSDDIILFSNKKEELQEYLKYINDRILDYGLVINENKYKYFEPNDTVEFLGLKFTNQGIDISNHAELKIKKTIKRWCKKARKEIEMNNKDFEKKIKAVISRFNWKLYKSYIIDTTKFGWAYYAFRYITNKKSLEELDIYCKDTLKFLKTGKYSKGNKYALTDEEIYEYGYVNFTDMYDLFHMDFDYYCDVVARL